MSARRKAIRAALLAVAGLLLALGFTLAAPPSAHAAEDDQIDKFAVEYEMGTDGVLQAKETIVYRFGSNSGRHGIDRTFITREKYDEENDAVYTVDVESVTSPTSGVSTKYDKTTTETDGGRGEQLRVRIGDPDRTISSATATYVITYTVKGAMRTFSGYDEFFWDVIGPDRALIQDMSVAVTVPGGAVELSCFAGPAGSTQECGSHQIKGGVAEFTQGVLASNAMLSIGVKIKSGLVSDNAPHLEPDGSKLSAAEKAGLAAVGGLSLVTLVGSPIVGVRWWRKHGRDERYAGLPPGTVPLPGHEVPVVPSDPDLPIPVAFTPPRIPVAEAGLLVDGKLEPRETAATIIDLAVRGALTVQSTGKKDFQVDAARSEQSSGTARDGVVGSSVRPQWSGNAGGSVQVRQPGKGGPGHGQGGAWPGRRPGLVSQAAVGRGRRWDRLRRDRSADLCRDHPGCGADADLAAGAPDPGDLRHHPGQARPRSPDCRRPGGL